MADYISKQKVLDYLNGYLHSLGDDADTLFNRGQRRALINSIQDILAVKVTDVQPVKRGKWSRLDYDIGHDHVCSVCKCKNDRQSRFCPDCGADMQNE